MRFKIVLISIVLVIRSLLFKNGLCCWWIRLRVLCFVLRIDVSFDSDDALICLRTSIALLLLLLLLIFSGKQKSTGIRLPVCLFVVFAARLAAWLGFSILFVYLLTDWSIALSRPINEPQVILFVGLTRLLAAVCFAKILLLVVSSC